MAALSRSELIEHRCERNVTPSYSSITQLWVEGDFGWRYETAGIQEIVDHLDVERLAWEREDRSIKQAAQDYRPRTFPKQEPYRGTEHINLTKEEGVTYEPPENPPPPPHRKD